MKNQIFTLTLLLSLAVSGRIFGQNVGIGEPNPGSTLSVKGGMSVGTTYSSATAPTGGLIIEGRMGVGTSNPDTNAILDMSGAVSKGIKMPRTTAAQRAAIASPSKGLMLFDTDSNNVYFHNGTSWTPMLSLSSVTNLVSNTVSSLTSGLLGGGGSSTGTAWYTGSGTPGLLTSGNTGDYYINTANGDYYKKTSALAWTLQGSLMGPTGSAGSAGAAGAAGARGATGVTGATGTNGTNGAAGATGAAGTNGTNGANGAAGATGAVGAAGAVGATGAGYYATSATSLTIASSGNTPTITTQSGLAYVVGSRVRILYQTTPADYMEGTVASYSGTGMVITITNSSGSGTFASWYITLAGNVGAAGTNGTNGAVGATGAAGTNGTNGATGATGAAGAQGIQGVTGPTGAAGTNGANGTNGAAGATGAAGTNGTNGATGATGAAGAQGIQGVTGPTGAAGTNGANGTNGAAGATGAAGTNGANGAAGATGAAGAQGIQGVTGPTGAAGTNGSNGAVGATGAAGTNGINGAVGATGAGGAAGTNGATWITGTVAPTGGQGNINDLYLNTSTDIYYVKTAATTWTQKNDLDGVTGATGPSGSNGTNGAAGATGPTGAAGPNGTNGAVGATGPTGAAGTNGTNGTVGATGAAGTAGAAGTNGSTWITGTVAPTGGQGNINDIYLNTSTDIYYVKTAVTTWTQKNDLDGVTGATGPTGSNGTNGAAGATGPTGAAGTNGINGAAGATGPTGAAGTNGTNGAAGAAGAAGTNGSTWITGTVAPTGGQGNINDLYLNTSTDVYYIKTAATTWTQKNDLDGAPGATGAAGANGTNGAVGATGPAGAAGAVGAAGATGPTGSLSAGSAAGNTPYWNGTSWIVNTSNIYNDGANIGIGTTSPSNKFQVNDGSIAISNDNSTAGALYFYEPSTGGGNYMAFKAQAMAANITYTLPAADGTSGQVLSTNGSGTLSWGSGTTGWGLSGNSATRTNFIGTTSNTSFNIRTNNVQRMAIDSVGNVGIGTTPVATGLSAIYNYPGKNVITIENSSSSGYSSMDFWDNTGALSTTFGYANTGTGDFFQGSSYMNCYGNNFILTANSGAYNMFIQGATGYVGINTNTPLDNFDVYGGVAIGSYGGANAAPNNGLIVSGYVGIGNYSPISLFSVGSSSQFQVNGTGNIVKINNVTTSFPSSQGASSTYLKNDGSGNLTWATVSGAAGPTGPAGATGPTGATGATGATGSMVSGSAAGNTPYWNGSSWVVNSSNIYNDGGNVGIGTASPNSTFEVTGGIATNMSTQSGTSAVTLDNTASVWYFTGSAGVTLPSASSSNQYRKYTIVNRTGSSKTISSCTSLTGGSSVTLVANTSIDVISTGSAWVQIR